MENCLHCGLEVQESAGFCCSGCEAAYELIKGMGLEQYYRRRDFSAAVRPLRPEDDAAAVDYSAHVIEEADGRKRLHLMVEGMQCAACVWLIESVLARQPGVVSARLNMSTRRLVLKWRADETEAGTLISAVTILGYRLVPYDPALLNSEDKRREKELLRAMAVAGFAAGNVMLLSISVWAGHAEGMGPATRGLLHWLSALIALPAIAYAGTPFFRSGLAALRTSRLNMDVPISIGVILASAMSLHETIVGGEHAYFDSAVSLLFFLLVGRYLEHRARGRARSAAEHLLALGAVAVTVLKPSGERVIMPPSQVVKGMTVLVAAGERIGVDGTVIAGDSEADLSLISGESMPTAVHPGDRVFAGSLNLSHPLTVRGEAAGADTLLAEIVRIMEAAERGRSRYVALADRIAGHYAPVVHGLALTTFLGWLVMGGADWRQAMINAIAVLIITCPCALGLVAPVVNVIASGRLFRCGVLIKSGTALERLAEIDTVAFDKTGTLTTGRLELKKGELADNEALILAASLAGASRHPLARALIRAAPTTKPYEGVKEIPGCGLELGEIRLGSRSWCGVGEDQSADPELWLTRPKAAPVRFVFEDCLRADAARVVAELKNMGYRVALISGDRRSAVASTAAALDIEDRQAAMKPQDKCRRLDKLAAEGRRVLMVGDGLNDAPALASAYASLSPSTAMDVSQTAADAVFQGDLLGPVAETLRVAVRARKLVRQNLALAFLYNAITVPLAVAGLVTPLLAAIAMSASSVMVIANALRLNER